MKTYRTMLITQLTLDVSGLSEAKIEMIKAFAVYLQIENDEQARQEIQHLWKQWATAAPKMTDETAAQIAEEAIAGVRKNRSGLG